MLQSDYQEEGDLLFFLPFCHLFGNTSAPAPLGAPSLQRIVTLDLP